MESLTQRINHAMGIARMGTFEWDIAGDKMTCDDALYTIYGIAKEDFSHNYAGWEKLLHPEDVASTTGILKKALEGTIDWNTSFRVIKSNGEIAHIRAVGFLERSSNGLPLKMSGVNWDITQEVKREEDFRAQKEFYETLFRTVPDPIYILNENFEVFYANHAFYEFIEYSMTLQEFSQKFSVEIKKRHEIVFRSEKAIEREDSFSLPSGRPVVALIKGTPATFSDGKKVVICSLRDISERKRMENELEQVRAQQIHASKLAALGEMAGGVAHEINNPLAVIDGKIQLLQKLFQQPEPPTPQTALNHLARAKEYLDRVAAIIRGVKNVSRTADQDPFMPFSLKDTIQDSLGTCSEKLRSEGVKIDLDLPANVDPKSIGRATQISQILLNLLNNSYDAVLEQPIRKIGIRVEDGKEFWKIHVTDSGKGIPLTVRPKIMRPFFTTKPHGKGTGLGLSISQSIAEMHAGRLYLNSESKQTRFTLELPKYTKDQGAHS